jgi:hypothetical protein
MISLSQGDHALPLPTSYTGTISVGQNGAPAGTTAQVSVTESGSNTGMSNRLTPSTSTTTTDPFPILINIRVPFAITLPLFGFTIHFPSNVNLSGTFDVAFFDPTQAINPPLNPEALGTLVAKNQTLTFTPPPGTKVTLMPNVVYTLSVARDVSSSYAGAAASILLPTQSNAAQPLASAGPLGANVSYQTGTGGTGFLQWQTITGAPAGVPPLIRGYQPTESLVVSASQPTTLTSVTVTADFSNGSVAPSSGSSGPGTFVPAANPTVLGPFPATVNGNQATFTVTPDSPIQLGSNTAWDFSLVTVTVCVPINVLQPCDSPSGANVRTSVQPNASFDVLVADESNLLNGPFTINATSPCSAAGINQGDNNGDNPPGYNDLGVGPKTELDVDAGSSSGTCTLTVSFNGVPVASTTVDVGESSSARSLHPLTLRPPVNGPAGYAIGGTH